ncbi:hypothetical protein ACLKA7_007783 [Drosophila subpalustris]
MDQDDIIVISDEEEPQPGAHVEDCDSDETQPRQSPRRGQRHRDPRRGRPNYGGRRQEERPRRYRHTVYHGTHRSVDRYDELVVCMAVEYSTMFIEVPQARNSPRYVEEPPSPPRFPALSESGGAPKSEACPCDLRIFPGGTVLTEPVIRMLRGEVVRRERPYRRTRFRIVEGDTEFNVNITADGAVTYLDEAKFPSAVAQSRQNSPLTCSIWTRQNSRQLWHNPGNIPTHPCSCVCRSLVGQRITRDDTLYRSLAS